MAIYYVTISGGTGAGTEGDPWSLSHAFANASAGDTVHIKTGNYGSGTHSISNNGTAGNTIKFIGYTTTIGDIVASNGSTFTYGDAVNSAIMPLLQGVRTANVGSGTGITANKNYIELHNFQIKYYNVGLSSVGSNNVINNVISVDHGDFNAATYNGKCFALNGANNTYSNNFGLNGGAEGYFFLGSNNTHSYNEMHSDNTTNPTDYYYLLGSEFVTASFNEVSNIYIERHGNLSHGGHGLIVKRDAKSNNFYDCTIVNTNIETSYYEATDNNFYRCDVDGTNLGGGILLRDGSHDNYFEDCTVVNALGIYMMHSLAGDMSANDMQGPFDNSFQGGSVTDSGAGIDFFSFNGIDNAAAATGHIFTDVTFNNNTSLFNVDRANSGTELRSCTITNIVDEVINDFAYGHSLNYEHQCTTSSGLGWTLKAEADLGLTCGSASNYLKGFNFGSNKGSILHLGSNKIILD